MLALLSMALLFLLLLEQLPLLPLLLLLQDLLDLWKRQRQYSGCCGILAWARGCSGNTPPTARAVHAMPPIDIVLSAGALWHHVMLLRLYLLWGMLRLHLLLLHVLHLLLLLQELLLRRWQRSNSALLKCSC